MSQLGLTCQTHDSGHETVITTYKVNWNKLMKHNSQST